jgi:hypothetical protein
MKFGAGQADPGRRYKMHYFRPDANNFILFVLRAAWSFPETPPFARLAAGMHLR